MISIEIFFTPVTEKKAEAEIYLFLTVFFLSTHTAYISHNATQTPAHLSEIQVCSATPIFCNFPQQSIHELPRHFPKKLSPWPVGFILWGSWLVHTTFHYLIVVSVSAWATKKNLNCYFANGFSNHLSLSLCRLNAAQCATLKIKRGPGHRAATGALIGQADKRGSPPSTLQMTAY